MSERVKGFPVPTGVVYTGEGRQTEIVHCVFQGPGLCYNILLISLAKCTWLQYN